MLATVVATTATLSSNSSKSTIVLDTFYFRSAETVRRERHDSLGSEHSSARVKKLAADFSARHVGGQKFLPSRQISECEQRVN